ncbi:hypothetical protein Anas_04338 [Armadillidium nasatum]|uniref:Uncharacterized protein n=1 Tax=Armadillidium nasatum TaxID=96803 RepID=A0A5N5SQX7_9CRUS|nr:hypothetical protein Anas_04338 [Armadillidium nasatum]
MHIVIGPHHFSISSKFPSVKVESFFDFFGSGNSGRSNNDYGSIFSELVKTRGNKEKDSTPDVSDILGNIVQRKKGGGGGKEVSDMSDFISSLLVKFQNGGQSNDISIFLKDLKLPYGVNVPQGLDVRTFLFNLLRKPDGSPDISMIIKMLGLSPRFSFPLGFNPRNLNLNILFNSDYSLNIRSIINVFGLHSNFRPPGGTQPNQLLYRLLTTGPNGQLDPNLIIRMLGLPAGTQIETGSGNSKAREDNLNINIILGMFGLPPIPTLPSFANPANFIMGPQTYQIL